MSVICAAHDMKLCGRAVHGLLMWEPGNLVGEKVQFLGWQSSINDFLLL